MTALLYVFRWKYLLEVGCQGVVLLGGQRGVGSRASKIKSFCLPKQPTHGLQYVYVIIWIEIIGCFVF